MKIGDESSNTDGCGFGYFGVDIFVFVLPLTRSGTA